MTETMVNIQGLVKRYGSFVAVKGLSLKIQRGEVFGLLGPNGAGKTTILECLEGLRKADDGVLLVGDCNVQENRARLYNLLGVQLQSSALPESIRVTEAISLLRAWNKLPEPSGLIERFGLSELMKKQFRELSTGQRRRLDIVLALMNRPEVLILDEPTAGLDVQSRAELHAQIRSIKASGITVILATHDMAEAEALCDRVAILIRGQLAVCGTPSEVTAAGNRETRIRLHTQKGSLLSSQEVAGASFVGEKDGYLEWTSRAVAPALIEILQRVEDAKDVVEDLRVERPSLEERFLDLVEGVETR